MKTHEELLAMHQRAEHIVDLIYYDGPMLSQYKIDNQFWFWLWYDVTDTQHKWTAFQISAEDVQQYIGSLISLLDAMEKSEEMYGFAISLNEKNEFVHEFEPLSFSTMSEDRKPSPKAMYCDELF